MSQQKTNHNYKKFNVKKCLRLIAMVRQRPVLWNKSLSEYKCCELRNDAWAEIAEMENLLPQNAKNMWSRLLSCYRATKAYRKKHPTSADREYGKMWFGLEAMAFVEKNSQLGKKEGPHESGTVTTKNFDASLEVVKSADKPTVVKLTAVTPQLDTTPQNQLDILNDNVQNSPPRMQTSVRLKRLVSPSSVQGPLRIVRKVPPQLGQTVTTTTNQSSVKSFVNLLEQELNALSEDYATMAQVEIYRIVGEFKLKDVSRRQARIQVQKLHVDKPQPVRILTVQKIQAQPDIPIEITPDLPIEIKTEPTS
ncbi:uncharacterized protein LOC131272544 isoform X3 [Anopheles coustani]|uniref:uncharacterized protein LOC131272544 isoform X3 n=1 Tax=Anopheles coustani TaxID=139045 RepID=UPI00265AD058|nr:uncharacterized protein LOC131272544 isoform X3 [Anopheles coustani]